MSDTVNLTQDHAASQQQSHRFIRVVTLACGTSTESRVLTPLSQVGGTGLVDFRMGFLATIRRQCNSGANLEIRTPDLYSQLSQPSWVTLGDFSQPLAPFPPFAQSIDIVEELSFLRHVPKAWHNRP